MDFLLAAWLFTYICALKPSKLIMIFRKKQTAEHKLLKLRLIWGLAGCILVAFSMSASGCKDKKSTQAGDTNPVVTEVAPPPPPLPPPAKLAPPTPSPEPKNAKVKISTCFGDMIVKLYDETPGHRDNFLMLADLGFYNGLLFHRCIKGFMVQGGDPDSKGAAAGQHLGMGGPGYTIPAEINPNLYHKKGALAAARMGDQMNPTKASSGSQFYIVQGQALNDMQLGQYQSYIGQKKPGFAFTEAQRTIYKTIGGTPMLDMDYTVFGEVIEGLNIVDSINAQPTAPGDRPIKDVIMNVSRLK
jgi:cyclophilin family peptidyl-prolyl cis-trans isomerase